MIVKDGSQFTIRSEKGKPLGSYPSKDQAEQRLAQIERIKHIKPQRPTTRLGKVRA